MSSTNQVQVVSVEELADDIRSESKGHSAIVLAPPLNVLIGI